MKEHLITPAALIAAVCEATSHGGTILIAGTGTSMEPFIRADKDKVLLAPLPERPLLAGDIVLYRRTNGQAVLHRIYRVHRDCFDMLGDGQLWIEKGVTKQQLLAFVQEIHRPEGVCRCDTAQARQRACSEMKRRIRRQRPRHLIAVLKRRLWSAVCRIRKKT